MHRFSRRRTSLRLDFGRAALLVVACTAIGCADPQPPAEQATTATPIYNTATGRLEELVSDRDGDGKVDTRALMDGTRIVRIEIDRNGDGRADRWETYGPPATAGPANVIELAEEAGGVDSTVTRREVYADGVLQRVEEDADADGRMDKWETYEGGRLTRLDMDLAGAGRPTRRMIYGESGAVVRLEDDADGDGVFRLVTPPAGGGR